MDRNLSSNKNDYLISILMFDKKSIYPLFNFSKISTNFLSTKRDNMIILYQLKLKFFIPMKKFLYHLTTLLCLIVTEVGVNLIFGKITPFILLYYV